MHSAVEIRDGDKSYIYSAKNDEILNKEEVIKLLNGKSYYRS